MVFYRKYRPQKISELDLIKVRDKLTSILSSQEIPHAFLFSGPKGLGKTSAARILAKAINCERLASSLKNEKDKELNARRYQLDANLEPCNSCDACISITNGSNLDVLEIDAASNRGIDEIRDLRDKIKFTPVSLAKKVYIIDEVHMLTTEAFNALLKTLEEPPSHALFILCTTEPWKLLDTIISRCFYVQFEKPSHEELTRSLERIIKGENFNFAQETLDEIYELADGSFRDGAKVIEELALFTKGGKVTKEIINSLYKTKTIDGEIQNLLKFLSTQDTKEALLVIDRLSQNGVDFKIVIEKLVASLRQLLFLKAGVQEFSDLQSLPDVKQGQIPNIQLNISKSNQLIEYFSAAYKDLKFAVLPQIPLELAIVKWCVIDKVESGEFKVEKSSEIKSAPSRSDLDTRSDLGKKDDFFKQLIEAVKKDNHSVAGVLRGCKLVEIGEKDFKLEAAYKFHKDKLSDVKAKEIIEKKAEEILGKRIALNIQAKK